jgi:hypothetical protein
MLAANRGYKLTWNLEHAPLGLRMQLSIIGDQLLLCEVNTVPDLDAASAFDEALFFSRRTSRLSLSQSRCLRRLNPL